MTLMEEKTLADHDINVKSMRQELQLLEEQLHGRNEPQPSSTVTNADTVSRQAVIGTVHKIILGFFSDEDGVMNDTEKTLLSVSKAVCNGVRELPSAQPELETVKCIIGESCMDIGDADFSMKCAKCGAEYYHVEYYDYDYNFCPNCGRRWRKQGG